MSDNLSMQLADVKSRLADRQALTARGWTDLRDELAPARAPRHARNLSGHARAGHAGADLSVIASVLSAIAGARRPSAIRNRRNTRKRSGNTMSIPSRLEAGRIERENIEQRLADFGDLDAEYARCCSTPGSGC